MPKYQLFVVLGDIAALVAGLISCTLSEVVSIVLAPISTSGRQWLKPQLLSNPFAVVATIL